MMKKHALLLGLSLALALMLCACDSGTPSTEPAADPSATDSGPRTDLNLSSTEAVETLDPHYTARSADRAVEFQIYEPLYLIDDDSSEIPLLATDYSVSEDGLTYTFNLRQGVLFHNGEELKASDVVFTVERCREAPRMYAYVEPIASVEAADDYTVVITLSYEYAPFIQYIGALQIVNEKFVTEVGDDALATQTCGTGPYMLNEFVQAQSVSITAFPDYWQGEASIKDIDWKIITDTSTTLVAFEAGELDYISVPSANWPDIEASGLYNTELLESNHVTYLILNHTVEPFNNKLVRQAISHAINRDDMCLMALDGLATPAYTLAHPDRVFGATDDCTTFEYDPEAAMDLLAQAGYPDGFNAGVIKTIGSYFQKVAQVAQSNLLAVGIQCDIEMAETSAYVTDCTNGNFGIAVMGSSMGNDFAMFDMLYASQYIDSNNYARYSNPEVDDLFAQGVATVNPDERLAIYSQLIEIVQDDAVYVPIFFRQSPVAYDKNLNTKFYEASGLSTALYYEWSWS